MIRREILDNPDEVLKTFDFFNDFCDTNTWLLGQAWRPGSDDRTSLSLSAALTQGKLVTAYEKWLEEHRRETARYTEAGALLVRYGFEPYDTERSARDVAEKAAEEIGTLHEELENFRRVLLGLVTLDDLAKAKLAVGHGMSATMYLEFNSR